MDEFGGFDIIPEELSYQRVSEDIHKKVWKSWCKLNKSLEPVSLPEAVRDEVTKFNELMIYFFE